MPPTTRTDPVTGPVPRAGAAVADRAPRTPARSLRVRERAARRPISMVWFGVVLFSAGPVVVADAGFSGTAFSFWRLWIGVVVLGLATLAHQRWSPRPATAVGLAWAAGSGLAFAAHQVMFMTAVQQTSVVDVTLMNTLAPVVVGLLARPLFGERAGRRFWLWSAVAMVGAALLVAAGSSGPTGDATGMALAAGNVVCFAVYFVGTKAARPHLDTVPFLFWTVVASALGVSAWVTAVGEPVTPVTASDLARAAFVAILPGAVGHFSVTWSLRWIPANVPPVVMLTIPAISGGLAWLLLDQPVRATQVLAGVLTLVGVLGAVRAPSRGPTSAPEALVLAEET